MIKVVPVIEEGMSSETTVLRNAVETSSDLKGGGSGPGGTARQTDKLERTSLKRRPVTVNDKPAKRRRWKSLPGKHRRFKKNVASKATWKKHMELRTSNAAPYNSNQFLISDHGGETIRYLDSALGVRQSRPSSERGDSAPTAVAPRRVTRARESSFSLDSDEDFYYSSPEDEEEFLSREFIKEYNYVRTNRLVDMSKADLIQEYLQMEQRVDTLEKRLKRHEGKEVEVANDAEEEEETDSNASDSKEVTEQIRLFQKEILRLEAENERLRNDNIYLVQRKKLVAEASGGGGDSASACSTCSCSSSCSSSSSTDSCSSSDAEEDDQEAKDEHDGQPEAEKEKPIVADGGAKAAYVNERDDTGYESSHSGSNAKMNACVQNNEQVVSSTTSSAN